MFEFFLKLCHHWDMPKKIDAANVTELPDGPAGEHGLTARQLKILGAIKDALETNGYPPSMREIGVVAGLPSLGQVPAGSP
jgi:repressor LexA